MIQKLTIIGILFSMAACLRAASGQSALEIQIAIAIAEAEAEARPAPEAPAVTPDPDCGFVAGPFEIDEALLPAKAFRETDLPAGAEPTPMPVVSAAIDQLGPLAGRHLEVYGSGFDARLEIIAARREPTLTVVGIEINPELAASARRYVEKAGLEDRVKIITGDATKISGKVDLGIAYLFDDVLSQMKPRIKKLGRFVSIFHPVPGMTATRQTGDLFVYDRVVAVAAAAPAHRTPVAMYGGKAYTGPVCNRRNCGMCQRIREQLAAQSVSRDQPAGRYVNVRVKHCNGRTCWYETQQVWQPY